ncbi:hypothetical protein ABZ330_19000 [Streptomyces sp. NPDC006172]|uniref:hypothetical protein n=1 Tax=Streptomyces sp. NPDC006172 TaxID=3154470 RepID=UPI0033E07A79
MAEHATSASEVLADEEIELLCRALLEWSGPARCSDQLAVGMGFAGERDLVERCVQLRAALSSGLPMTPSEWARTLLAVEIVFVSDLAGSGFEWRATTGRSDEQTIAMLRSIQRKLAGTVRPYYGRTPSD